MPKTTLLERLDAWLAEHRPAFHKALAKGAKPSAIAKAEKALGRSFPKTLADIFAWRGRSEGRLQKNWSLMSLSEAHAIHDMRDELLEAGEFEKPLWWKTTWFPFLENGGGDHVCVDLETGEVVEFWHDEDWRTIEYPSIDKWLEVFVTTLEKGLWTEDHEYGFFEVKQRPFDAAVKATCPGYPKKRDAGKAQKPDKKSSAKPSVPAMDATNARRLVDAWRASMKDTAKVNELPHGSFWYAPKYGPTEAELDAKRKVLSLRRAPVGFGAKDKIEREKLAKGVFARKEKLLEGTTSEVVKFRAKPNEGWFIVLRMDFGDPSITDAEFLAANKRLVGLMATWRA